jgi:ATP-dependent protease ClpP protease subunit
LPGIVVLHCMIVICLPLSNLQKGGPKLGYEAEAFAIYDTMRYIKPPISTVCVGSAFGEAAMLLAAGEQGKRAALPSATIMLRQPIQRFTQMQASDIDIYRNELRKTQAEIVRQPDIIDRFTYSTMHASMSTRTCDLRAAQWVNGAKLCHFLHR